MVLDGLSQAVVQDCAAALQAGELVAFATETVYGLGADAGNDAAVAKIFAAKGRPSNHPLIVHVADQLQGADGLARFAAEMPGFAQRLTKRFWPGPLTLILPRRPDAGLAAAGGQDSIGLRCPAHPVAQSLLRACCALGVPGLAAPSANLFGRVSPTTAAHVQQEFGRDLWVLDGGSCAVGIESAIVDCTREVPALLRPGTLDRRRLEQVMGQALAAPDAASPRAPGMLVSHYAPRAKVALLSAQALHAALRGPLPQGLAVYSQVVPPASAGVVHRAMPSGPDAVAHELFAMLREFDALGAAIIWVERPPPGSEWDGVRDRLQRAAAA